MSLTILLSASLPASEGSNGWTSCDPVEWSEAVSEVARDVLGKGGHLVYGGHPSVTPLILRICQEREHRGSMTVYQSERFRHEITPATWTLNKAGWASLRFIESVTDRPSDLELMRIAMVTDEPIAGAIFIGGDGGVAAEHRLVESLTYQVPRISLSAPGGAAADLSGSERTLVDMTSRRYWMLARQVSRALGLR